MKKYKLLHTNTEKRDSIVCRILGHKLRSSVVMCKSMDPTQSNMDFISLLDVSCSRCRNYADIDSSIDFSGHLVAYAKIMESIIYGENSSKADGSSLEIRDVRVSYHRRDVMKLAPAKKYYDLERGILVDNRKSYKEFMSKVVIW